MGTVRHSSQGLSLGEEVASWEHLGKYSFGSLWRVAVLTGRARPVVAMPPAPVREMLLTNLSLHERTTVQEGAASGRHWILVVRGLGVSEVKRD